MYLILATDMLNQKRERNANSLWRHLILETGWESPSLGLWDPGQQTVPHHHWKPFSEWCQLPTGIKNMCGRLPEDRQLIHSLTRSKCCPWLKSVLKIAYMEHMLLTPFPEPCCVTMLLICTERQYKNNFFTNHCCVFWRIEFMASSSPLKFLRKSCKHFLLCSVCWENKYEAYLCLLHKTLSCVSAH